MGYEIKDIVGGQRFGFVILSGFWILVFFESRKYLKKIVQFVLIIVLFLGLVLTFSRSTLVSLLTSFTFYFYYKMVQEKGFNLFNLAVKLSLITLTSIVCILLVAKNIPQAFDFFNERFFVFFQDGGIEKMDLNNDGGSEGYRIFMFKQIIDFVMKNPLTGSGYLGVWVLFDDQSGSAHSQYTDVLFRTGFIGLLLYFYLLQKLIVLLFRKNLDLYIGLVGILIYGIFHETFKESQGAFILTFFIGLLSSEYRSKKKNINYT